MNTFDRQLDLILLQHCNSCSPACRGRLKGTIKGTIKARVLELIEGAKPKAWPTNGIDDAEPNAYNEALDDYYTQLLAEINEPPPEDS